MFDPSMLFIHPVRTAFQLDFSTQDKDPYSLSKLELIFTQGSIFTQATQLVIPAPSLNTTLMERRMQI